MKESSERNSILNEISFFEVDHSFYNLLNELFFIFLKKYHIHKFTLLFCVYIMRLILIIITEFHNRSLLNQSQTLEKLLMALLI